MWQSADPILGSYLNGKPNAGVFAPGNLGLYTYAYQKPLNLADPDGNAPRGGADHAVGGGFVLSTTGCQNSGMCHGTQADGTPTSPEDAAMATLIFVATVGMPALNMATEGALLPAEDAILASVGGDAAVGLLGRRLSGSEGSAAGRQFAEEVKLGATPIKDLARLIRCSFAEGTLVMTRGGLKPIESIKEGDYVLARDEHTGKESWKKVLGTFARWHDDALNLTLTAEGGGQTETIVVTSEHPFQLKGKGWTPAGNLKAGDEVEASSGRWLKVTAVAKLSRKLIAYNMEVQDFHTYFVGSSEVWVHNTCFDWAKMSGQLREAAQGGLRGSEGKVYNFNIGSATRGEADAMGKAWVGEGYSVASDGRTLLSENGLRQYRPPSTKPNSPFATTGTQANFETRAVPSGKWTGNGHLDITN